METRTRNTIVLMPDDSFVEVSYYCSDARLDEKQRSEITQLMIQLDDCLCSINIDRTFLTNTNTLERIVHNKVVNAKGHLC